MITMAVAAMVLPVEVVLTIALKLAASMTTRLQRRCMSLKGDAYQRQAVLMKKILTNSLCMVMILVENV